MIQFNLLPAVKLEFVKAQRTKRLAMLFSTLVAAGSVVVLAVLFVGVQIVQKKHSRDLSADIKAESSKLESVEDLNKILTIQNQLNSLTSLHDQKPVATRLFEYIKQLTPASVNIAKLSVDFDAHTMSFNGSADTLGNINKFVDTLKFTSYKTQDAETNAFSEVVLESFGKDDNDSRYEITLKFDPSIFSSASDVVLIIPANKITTRSQTEKPTSLFEPIDNSGGDQ